MDNGATIQEKQKIPELTLALLAALSFLYPNPALALVLGIVLSLTLGNPHAVKTAKAMKSLLQISVVGLGFGMNLQQVLQAGQTGFLFSLVSIVGTIALGMLLGRALKNNASISYLISVGTAICGGSAIAAVGPLIAASAEEMAAALGTVFLLNAAALIVFPVIGHWYHLGDETFGMWAAIAIHDTSSVVGAAAKYSDQALQVAVPVKLARALWIIPVAAATPWLFRHPHGEGQKAKLPLFIFWFLLAAAARTYLPPLAEIANVLFELAKRGLSLTLFLIGAQLSRKTLQTVGLRPILQGVLLWCIVSCVSFAVLLHHPI